MIHPPVPFLLPLKYAAWLVSLPRFPFQVEAELPTLRARMGWLGIGRTKGAGLYFLGEEKGGKRVQEEDMLCWVTLVDVDIPVLVG
jgi:hypothetical protein